jgi:GNAT superfamily N-acetyltransferase
MTPECLRLGLLARPIEIDEDVETLRLIRNACKDGFSHDNSEISQQQQEAWWTLMRGKVKGWLYWVGGEVVGYGLVRQTDDQRWWTSVAVLPDCAGRGYGGAITADLARRLSCAVWATARLDNPAALRLHRVDDWDEIGRDDRLVTYRTKPHVYHEQAITEWRLVGAP